MVFAQLNMDIDHKMSEHILLYTDKNADEAVRKWYASENVHNGICMRLINYNAAVLMAIAFKVSHYYGGIIYFGYNTGVKYIEWSNTGAVTRTII